MIIDYIQLNNFLSHSDTVMHFENGVNIIYGKNGAGKSSIVDAIRFALFGEKRGDRIAELIRNSAKECSVTIGFRLNERYYEVFRSLTLGKSSITGRNSWIKLDGAMIAETAEGVTREIQNGLKIPKDIFLNSVFVRQGEMDTLISETPANREKLFSKIIGIDVLSENAQKIKTIRDMLRLEEARYSNLEERMERILNDLASAESEMASSRKILEGELAREKEARGQAETWDKKREEAMGKKARSDELSRSISDLEGRISRLEKEIEAGRERLGRISFSKEEKERIENDPLFSKRAEVSKYFRERSELMTLEASLENVRKSISEYEKDGEKLESLSENHHRFRKIEDEINSLEVHLKSLTSESAIYRSLVEETERERKKHEEVSRILSGQEYISLRGLDRSGVSAMAGSLEKELREMEGSRNALKERIGGMNRQLAELRKSRDMLGDHHRCPLCGSDLEDEHLTQIHAGYQEKEEEFHKSISDEVRKVEALNSEYVEKEKRLESLRGPAVERYLSALDEEKRLSSSIEERRKRIDGMKEAVEELPSLEKRLEELKKERQDLQPAESEYSSISYAMGRMPIENLRENLTRHRSEEDEKKAEIATLVRTMGFEPGDADRQRLEDITAKHERILIAETEYERVSADVERNRKSLEEFRSDIAGKKEQKELLGDVESNFRNAVENYTQWQESLTSARQSIATLNEKIRTFEMSISRLRDEQSSLNEERNRLSRLKDASSKLDRLRDAFDRGGIQALIRKDSSISINSMTRNYLSSFNFDFDDVRIDENFDIRVISNGVEEALDSLSGGERISLAIAVRLAIARYLTGRVSTIIMDEPTNFLDEDRRNNLKDIIQYSLKDENMIQQMIMITHHSELTSAADSSFEVTKSAGISTVSPG